MSETGRNPEVKQKRSNEAWEWTKSIGIAFLLAILIRQFCFSIFLVDGSSMVPTLHNNERLIVNKIVYHLHQPHYNDVVVFQYPSDPSVDYIKRVIGLPGDKIEIHDFKVFRNGQVLNEPYIAEPTATQNGQYVVPPGRIFVMGDNRNYSKDSRDPSVGYVPLQNVVGRADLVWWPLSQFHLLKSND